MNANQNLLQMAKMLTQDALREENLTSTRERCAFVAGYFYLLVALDAPAEDTHPTIETLQNGPPQLDIGEETMAAALEFLNQQHASEGVGDLLASLLHWGQDMKELAGAQ